LFAEAENIRAVPVKNHNYTRFIDLRMETSKALQIVIPSSASTTKGTGKCCGSYYLKVQSVLMGWVDLVVKSADDMKKIMVESEKMPINENICVKHHYNVIEILWTACGLNKALKTKFVNGMILSLNRGKVVEDLFFGSIEKVAGDGYKDTRTSESTHTNFLESEQFGETEVPGNFLYYNKFKYHPELLQIPDTMSQKQDTIKRTMACSFLSCVLLVHTTDKNLSNDIVRFMKTDEHLDMNNMELFKNSGDQPSVNSLMQKWSVQLSKSGCESVNTIASTQTRSGLYLCSISGKFGLRHAVGIDYNRKMIWDPSEKEALPLTTKFFRDLLQHVQTFQKDNIKMFELRKHYRKNTPYNSYIGSKMIIKNTNKICEVIAVQKKEGNTKEVVKLLVISEDGKDLEEIYGNNLKKMIE
jgi:hypothetical protein